MERISIGDDSLGLEYLHLRLPEEMIEIEYGMYNIQHSGL